MTSPTPAAPPAASARERRDGLMLLAALVLAVTPALALLPASIAASFGLFLAWRLLRAFRPQAPLRAWGQGLLAIVSSGLVYAQFGTLFGRAPGMSLLVLFVGLKMLELHTRRDRMLVAFLCFFLLVTAYPASQAPWVALVSLVAVAALILCLLSGQYGRHQPEVTARARRTLSMLLQAAPIALLLFLIFPRAQGPLWGSALTESAARTGLSASMRPGDVARLVHSDELALRVQFEGRAPAASSLYWRGPVLGHFDGARWTQLPSAPAAAVAPERDTSVDRATLRYTVTLEASEHPWLPVLEWPVRVLEHSLEDVRLREDRQLTAGDPPSMRVRYRVESRIGDGPGPADAPELLPVWRQLPPGFNPRTRELAARWRAEEATDGQRVARVLRHFREENFRYTLDATLTGRDGVDDFLFGQRAGFCEHYAGAFVVLMRAMDIPARVVTGYLGGDLNPVDGTLTVRQADAHAWAEIWLPRLGWQRIDPTAAIAPERIDHGRRALRLHGQDEPDTHGLWGGMRPWFEAAGNAWNGWALSYDRKRQTDLLGQLGLSAGDSREAGLIMGLALGLFGAAAAWTLRRRAPQDPLEQAWQIMCRRLAKAGVARAPHETPSQVLERARARLGTESFAHAATFVSRYLALRYGPDGGTAREAQVRELRRTAKRFRP